MDLTTISWQPKSLRAIDVARSLRRPSVAKLDWSLYGNHADNKYGDRTLLSGHHSNNSTAEDVFLLHSRQCSTRVTASNVVRNDNWGFVDAGPSLAIPSRYQGWFQILHHPMGAVSYENKARVCTHIKTFFSLGVSSFLACTNITGFQVRTQDRDYQQKCFPAGVVFHVQGAFTERVSTMCCFRKGPSGGIKYLKCYAKGAQGGEVLIPMDTKGKFYPVGESHNIEPGYVYQIHQLLDSVRETPGYILELVHGKPPPKHEQFSGILRLDDVIKQEVVVACSLENWGRQPTLLEFPVHSLVSFYLATNGTNLKIVKETIAFVERNLAQYMACMKVVTTMVLRTVSPKIPQMDKQQCNAESFEGDLDSFGSGSFTDYDTIPCDDPIYENDGEDFLHETARRLREELAKRAANLEPERRDYVPAFAVCKRKNAQKKEMQTEGHSEDKVTKVDCGADHRLESFLVTTVDEMQKKASQDCPTIESQQDMETFLDDMFDCDVMSASTRPGPVCVFHDDTKDGSDHDKGNSHSSISSLYKKVKQTHNVRRSDSGMCSACVAGVVGSDVTTWRPPDDLSTMSVEEVGRALRYIGLRTEIIECFMNEQIDGHQLHDIGEDLLKEAFPQMNRLDIKKLIDFKAGWRPKRDQHVQYV